MEWYNLADNISKHRCSRIYSDPSGPTGAQGATGGLTISTSGSSPSAGDMWWDSDSGQTGTLTGAQGACSTLLNTGSTSGSTGAQGAEGNFGGAHIYYTFESHHKCKSNSRRFKIR